MDPMPRPSPNWSVPFSPRAALWCAMDSSTGPAPIMSSDYPRNLGFTSTELPNEQWRRSARQRASSSLSTEPVGGLAQRNPPIADNNADNNKEAGYAGACHRAV